MSVRSKIQQANQMQNKASKEQAVLEGAAAPKKSGFFGKKKSHVPKTSSPTKTWGSSSKSSAPSRPAPAHPAPVQTGGAPSYYGSPKQAHQSSYKQQSAAYREQSPPKGPQNLGGAQTWATTSHEPAKPDVKPFNKFAGGAGSKPVTPKASSGYANRYGGGSGSAQNSTGSKPKYGGASGWQTTNHSNVSPHTKPFNKFAGADGARFEESGKATSTSNTSADWRQS